MRITFVIIYLLLSGINPSLLYALPLEGTWKIVSYQFVGYPEMSEQAAKDWIGTLFTFTDNRQAILRGDQDEQRCLQFNYQITEENSEAYFLVGYKVKPQRLGVTQQTIDIINVSCQQSDSWLEKFPVFIKNTPQQMITDQEGVLFFLVKQPDDSAILSNIGESLLLITPQSVGTLNPDTLFDQKTIAQALAGYQITSSTQDNHQRIITASRQSQPVLKIYPHSQTNTIHKIHITDQTAVAPGDVKIGQRYQTVFNNTSHTIVCEAGKYHQPKYTSCMFRNLPMIEYIFDYHQPLKQANLVEIIWTADRALIDK